MPKILFLFLVVCISCTDEGPTALPPDECIDANRWEEILVCSKIYDPVCGCNNVTYENDCYAKMAGVIRWTKGKCAK